MKNIYSFIETFYDMLVEINLPNLVISGANALKAHGLILNREPADLDVAVYSPSIGQMERIMKGEKAMSAGPYPEQRVFKFYKDGLCMDVVVEYEICPDNLLFCKVRDEYFKVQSVEQCIEAKRMYNREKDWNDFQDLKNSNFNMLAKYF